MGGGKNLPGRGHLPLAPILLACKVMRVLRGKKKALAVSRDEGGIGEKGGESRISKSSHLVMRVADPRIALTAWMIG